jgi:hypothetical protein
MEHFDRHDAISLLILSPIDYAHTTATEYGLDLIPVGKRYADKRVLLERFEIALVDGADFD